MEKPSYKLAFGNKTIEFSLPEIRDVDYITPPTISASKNPLKNVNEALIHPLGGFDWQSVKPNGSIAIAINDKTRPVPLQYLIPPLLAKLSELNPRKIIFIIATGTHVPLSTEEMESLLPSHLRENIEIISHDCDNKSNLTFLGHTTRGTPVWINKKFMQAELKIAVGNIEPHHFAGFSGGAKSVAIGLAGRETINQNHRLLLDPNSFIGIFTENPLRQDIEEIGNLAELDFCLNSVLNLDLEIVKTLAGTPEAVMRYGIPISKSICQTPVYGHYDLVIASVGGFPKDINLYQSQKALSHASLFLRDGGVTILVAECKEGIGSNGFVDFMQGCSSWNDVMPKFERMGFQVGPHKALQIARQALRTKIILLSSMPEAMVRSVLIEPASSIDEAINKALASFEGTQPIRCAILPHATNTIPLFEGE